MKIKTSDELGQRMQAITADAKSAVKERLRQISKEFNAKGFIELKESINYNTNFDGEEEMIAQVHTDGVRLRTSLHGDLADDVVSVDELLGFQLIKILRQLEAILESDEGLDIEEE